MICKIESLKMYLENKIKAVPLLEYAKYPLQNGKVWTWFPCIN